MKSFVQLLGICLVLGSFAVPGVAQEDEVPRHDWRADEVEGFYVGEFGPNKITVRIEKVVGNTVLGYSVVAGNQRAFSGSWKPGGDGMVFEAREPGDDKYDGVFTFTVDPAEAQELKGKWVENRTGREVNYQLQRRQFRYDPMVGKYPQSSTRRLTEADVENMKPEELRIMRSEMYARHGYSFKKKDMRRYFDAQDWYMPMSSDISSQLTDIEAHNHDLIKRYENYGEEFYDEFGR